MTKDQAERLECRLLESKIDLDNIIMHCERLGDVCLTVDATHTRDNIVSMIRKLKERKTEDA